MTTVPQSGDGYKCTCGYITDNRMKLLGHLRDAKHGVLPGGESVVHKSAGRVNMLTGETTMPPYEQRTPEQLKESTFGKKAFKTGADGKPQTIRTTEILANATEVRFVPRIYTCNYTPIMQAAQDAAVKYYSWRKDMPLENFLDTVLYLYFKEHGITLGGYSVDDSLINENYEKEPEKVPEQLEEIPI